MVQMVVSQSEAMVVHAETVVTHASDKKVKPVYSPKLWGVEA